MTEEQIERYVAGRIDRLDRKFLSSDMSQTEYDQAIKAINTWADIRLALVAALKS